ncbi:MAG: hypothetical protein H6Q74_722 [Firmicutes bacterium]|nr:hypothetical protein [Bacillota bacterium]
MDKQTLKSGGSLTANQWAIICRFPAPRLVLSTSAFNGGYMLADAVFNQRLDIFVDCEKELPGGSMEAYLALKAGENRLDFQKSTGLLTCAHMNCRGFSAMEYNNILVEVVATAGVDSNAARAGDPAGYYEDGEGYQPVGGTINIIALTNSCLPQGTLAKALITITEAKTAALQELAVISPATLNWATGTGTDGIIIGCDPAAALVLTDAGTQSKLGELLCTAVKTAVKQALANEAAIEPAREGRPGKRLRKLGIAKSSELNLQLTSPKAAILLAMCQSILQEYSWGLLSKDDLANFIVLLEEPSMQPMGASLSRVLRKRVAETCLTEILNQYSGGVQ